MKERSNLVLFVSNIDFIIEQYINKLKTKNKNYHFEFLYGNDDKNETSLKIHLRIGTFFSQKKFIILKDYRVFSNEAIDLMKKTQNRVWIIFTSESSLFFKLSKTKLFIIKKEIYKTASQCIELVNTLSTQFVNYDNKITPYLIKLFGDEPNKLVQQMRILLIWKKSITKSDVVKFYKDVDSAKVYELLNYIINGNNRKLLNAFSNITSEAKIQHLFNYLVLVLKDLTKLRLYEDIGFVANALPISWNSKQLYASISNNRKITALLLKMKEIEEEQKMKGFKLTKKHFLNNLLLIGESYE